MSSYALPYEASNQDDVRFGQKAHTLHVTTTSTCRTPSTPATVLRINEKNMCMRQSPATSSVLTIVDVDMHATAQRRSAQISEHTPAEPAVVYASPLPQLEDVPRYSRGKSSRNGAVPV